MVSAARLGPERAGNNRAVWGRRSRKPLDSAESALLEAAHDLGPADDTNYRPGSALTRAGTRLHTSASHIKDREGPRSGP